MKQLDLIKNEITECMTYHINEVIMKRNPERILLDETESYSVKTEFEEDDRNRFINFLVFLDPYSKDNVLWTPEELVFLERVKFDIFANKDKKKKLARKTFDDFKEKLENKINKIERSDKCW